MLHGEPRLGGATAWSFKPQRGYALEAFLRNPTTCLKRGRWGTKALHLFNGYCAATSPAARSTPPLGARVAQGYLAVRCLR